MHGLTVDLRSAVRGLSKHPGFAITVVLALALGIGSATAIFSVLHAVALRPLPWSAPDRIVSFSEIRSDAASGSSPGGFLLGNVREWRDRSTTMETIAAHWNDSFTLTGLEQPIHLQGLKVTPDLFRVLGVGAQLGRVFEQAEVEAGEEKLALLSHLTWRRYFGGDREILGRALVLDDQLYTVVGVMPADFAFPDEEIEIWVPLLWRPPSDPNRTHEIMLPAIGRLKDGVSIEQAEAEGNILLAELRRERGMTRAEANRRRGAERDAEGDTGNPAQRRAEAEIERSDERDGAHGSAESGHDGAERRVVVRRGPDPGPNAGPGPGPSPEADQNSPEPQNGAEAAGGERRVVRRVVRRGPEEDGAARPSTGGASGDSPSGPGPGPEAPAARGGGAQFVSDSTLELRTLLDRQLEPIRPAMRVLIGAVALVLLIACANVANLLLTRGLGRRRELATRAALGAGRLGLGRILFAESLVLCLLGGVVGLGLAAAGLRLIRAIDPGRIPRLGEVGLHPTVVLFALGLSFLCAALFGLAPATQTRLDRLLQSLGRDSGPVVGGRSLNRFLRGGLVVAEVALALVLLIGAGLLANSFLRLASTDPGFETEGVVAAEVAAPLTKYPAGEARYAFFDEVRDRLLARPEIESAGFVNFLPPVRGRIRLGMRIAGRPQSDDPREAVQGDLRIVSPGYFETMSIRLLEGRLFAETDRDGQPPVIVVNESFAKQYFPEQRVVGERLEPFGEIVGVVGDVRAQGLDSDPESSFYLTIRQAPAMMLQHFDRMALVAKADRGFDLAPALRDALAAVDANVPVEGVETLEHRMSESVALPRFYAGVLSLFAVLALALAVLGVYGVLSFVVRQQRRETGIRMALGAQRSEVLGQTLWRGLRLTLLGVALGLGGAWALRSLVSGMLYGIDAGDPATFAGLALVLVVTSILACYIPGRRAASADPVVVLREE